MARSALCPVLLWWGDELRVLAGRDRLEGRTLAPGEDPVRALAQLLDAAGPGGGPFRLVYQADTLETHEVACPRAGRRRLGKSLAGDFRALAAPGAVWAAEPLRAGRESGGTRLHLDPGSRLPAFTAAAAARGWRLEGAWSLLSAIEAAVAGGALRGGIVLVGAPHRALVACLPPTGDRSAQLCEGPGCWSAALAALRGVQARFEDASRLAGDAVVEEGPAREAAQEAIREFGLSEATFPDLLAGARSLRPGGLADFLARPPFHLRRRAWAGLAAGVVLALLVAGGLRRSAIRERREAREKEMLAAGVRLLRDREASDSRRARAQSAEETGRALALLEAPPPPEGELLAAIARTLPPLLVLKSLEADSAGFVLAGSPCARPEGRREDPLAQFRRDLAAAGAWQLEPAATDANDAEFSVRGHFRPAALRAGAPDDRLAEVLAGLPTAAGFGAQWEALTRPWRVEAGLAERLAGGERRRYTLSAIDRTDGAWADLAEAVARLCRQPGLTVSRLVLVAEPGGSGALRRAEISVEARWR